VGATGKARSSSRDYNPRVRLDIRFPPPGFFLNDPRLVVTLGERTLYDGSFKSGFAVSVEVDPGRHVLETRIEVLGSVARTQQTPLALDSTGYRDVRAVEIVLEYSRWTGNFKKTSISARR
jgi:hypothetical protein